MAAAIGAQMIWGVFPAFIKLFQDVVDPVDLVAHRAIWSFILLVVGVKIIFGFQRSERQESLVNRLRGDSSAISKAVLATVFIAANWLMFVWAVSNDHAIDASLGYYICPQLIVLFGVVFLGERLGKVQWIAVGLATIGVTIMACSAQSNVWIGLVVAVAFGLYALVKKKTSLGAMEGLSVETGLMLVPALLFLYWRSSFQGEIVWPEATSGKVLLILSGPMTVIPLLLYAIAVKHISLSTVGLLQFIGPTIQFFLGVFVFGELCGSLRLLGFVFVWVGVAMYLFGLTRQTSPDAKVQTE